MTSIEFIHDFNHLHLFSNEWNQLAQSIPSPLLTFEWIQSASEAFYSHNKPFIGVLSDGTSITGIAPLILKGKGVNKSLRLIGVEYLGEPSGLLYQNADSLKQLFCAIKHLKIPFFLERIPVVQTQYSILKRGLISFSGIRFYKSSTSTRYLPIDTNWENYWFSLPSKRRNDLRRARKKAEAMGSIQVSIQSPSSSSIKTVLSEAYQVEDKSWKGRNRTSILANKRLKSFFSTFCNRALHHNWLRIGFLRVDDHTIATIIGLVFCNRFWLLKVGYDQQWAKCSPGMLLITECIHYAFEQHLEGFEFLGSDESWLRAWIRDDHKHDFGLYAFYPSNISGFFNLFADTCRRLKKLTIRS